MGNSIRVLVVDDYEPWRRYVYSTIHGHPELQVIAEVADGLEAVQAAQQLQPDLIVLDIGLPTINGLEAARRIRQLSPQSRILFLSENRSQEIAEEALATGAKAYVVKSAATSELLPAVEAVVRGKRFVSASLTGPDIARNVRGIEVADPRPPQAGQVSRHEAAFYSNDRAFLDGVTTFISPVLHAGNAVIVVATESHRQSLILRLQGHGLDMDAAIKQGRYVAMDVTDALSMFIVNSIPDQPRFLEAFGNLVITTAQAANGPTPRVAVFGEGTQILWAQGNAEAAIQTERLCNRLSHSYDVDILCGYSVGSVRTEMSHDVFQRVCEEHSAVYSQ